MLYSPDDVWYLQRENQVGVVAKYLSCFASTYMLVKELTCAQHLPWWVPYLFCVDMSFPVFLLGVNLSFLPSGGEAGPSNIEESKADRKRNKTGGAPSRPLPVSVCKDVIMSLAKQQGWKGWAFDGRKNLYTSTALMDINQEHKFQVLFFQWA